MAEESTSIIAKPLSIFTFDVFIFLQSLLVT